MTQETSKRAQMGRDCPLCGREDMVLDDRCEALKVVTNEGNEEPMPVELYVCTQCGHIDFKMPESHAKEASP